LIRLIDKGVSTQVMLNDGSMILHFCPYDIIARGSVVVRGIVCIDPHSLQDRVIPLCDFGGVFGERSVFAPDPEFFRRNPVPRGWTRSHVLATAATADTP